ncbi:MAG: 4-hydroxy-tetrahydrodipicolinate synthase [Xanthomonadales bacterium]|nr:4-hydroxy-tetrahydrodipicolinate synthase [Xanthomonadales bacterium]
MNLSGSLCALATPFVAATDAIDFDAFARLVDHQLAGGTRGLVVAGSTGEGAALDADEFVALVEYAVRRVDGRVPVLAGTGLQSTRRTIAQTRLAASAGADAALVVTPAYVRPTQEGLFRHFSEVAAHGDLPLVLYNVPTRTGCDLLPATVARLSTNPRIAGVKEALPAAERIDALLALRHADFVILSGDDPTCARSIAAGAAGVISVAANLVPAAMQSLCEDAARRGAPDGADGRSLQPLFDLLGAEPNPIPLKCCLRRIGIGDGHLRLPLTPLSKELHARVDEVLAALGLLEPVRAAG